MGERIVSARLNTFLSDDYCVLDDVILKTTRGTTQIDHIVVSKYGIFVIERRTAKTGYSDTKTAKNGRRISMVTNTRLPIP